MIVLAHGGREKKKTRIGKVGFRDEMLNAEESIVIIEFALSTNISVSFH